MTTHKIARDYVANLSRKATESAQQFGVNSEAYTLACARWGTAGDMLSRFILRCEHCDHPEHDPGKCEVELGDGYRGAEFQEALGPCTCGRGE